MLIAGLVLAGLAAALHVYIFFLESIAWESPAAAKTFGHASRDEARITKSLAFNQGFYNLFLAIAAVLGIVFVVAGAETIGLTLLFVGVGSMLAAALVLFISSPSHRGAAVKQGGIPLLAVIALVVAALL